MTLDFSNQNLHGRNFKGQDLTNANFSYADIRGVSFANSTLKNANFSNAKAGLQHQWATALLIFSLLLSSFAGFLAEQCAGALLNELFTCLSYSLTWIFLKINNREYCFAFNYSDSKDWNWFDISLSMYIGFFSIIFLCSILPTAIRRGIQKTLELSIIIGITFVAFIAIFLTIFNDFYNTSAYISAWSFAIILLACAMFIAPIAVSMAIVIGGIWAGRLVTYLGAITPIATSFDFVFNQFGGGNRESVGSDQDLAIISIGFLSGLLMLVSGYIARRALSADARDSLIYKISMALAAIGGTSFYRADLTDTDFSGSLLKSTDFRNANLTRTCFHQTKRLDWIRAGSSYLQYSSVRQLIRTGEGENKNFDRLNLQGINLYRGNLEKASFVLAHLGHATLQESNLKNARFWWADLEDAIFQGADLSKASFIGAQLNRANLKQANLSDAKLVQTQLDYTDLSETCLTGACIEDWGITPETKLDKVKCDYVFMRLIPEQRPDFMYSSQAELLDPNPRRKPDDWNKIFADGEFSDFIAPLVQTLDLYHNQNIDPRALAIALNELHKNHPEAGLEILSMEKRGRNRDKFLLRVETTQQANHSKLSSEYFECYDQLVALPPAALQNLLEEKDKQIRMLAGIVSTAVSRPVIQAETYHHQGEIMSEQKGNVQISGIQGDISGFAVAGENQTNSGSSIGDISGTVNIAIDQLSEDLHAGSPNLKDLLTQLQKVIEDDTDLSSEDKVDLFEQVKVLANAKQVTHQQEKEGLVRKAKKIFEATLKGLPDTAKTVEACSKILPLILKALGLPM